MTFLELETTIKKYMLLSDEGVIKLLCAYVVAMRLPIPPPWLFLLGASSGGKSMLLNALASVTGFHAIDDVTSASFISGAKQTGKEMSMLFTLSNNSFLVFKDFTTILSKQKEARGAIIGLLRKIYDGEMSKKTGNVAETQNWEGKIGVLGGATSSFYTKMADFADMGERTLAYVFKQPGKRELGHRIFSDGLVDFDAKTTMRAAFKNYLDDSGIVLPQTVAELPQFDLQSQEDLLDLAELTTTARSSVERDEYDRDHAIKGKHFQEQIGRFLKELMAMAYGMMILNHHDNGSFALLPGDKRILYNMALDSIPYNRRLVLVQLVRGMGSTTMKNLNQYLGLGLPALKIALGDMHAHGMLNMTQAAQTEMWELKPEWFKIITKFEYMDLTPTVEEVVTPTKVEPVLTATENQLIREVGI